MEEGDDRVRWKRERGDPQNVRRVSHCCWCVSSRAGFPSFFARFVLCPVTWYHGIRYRMDPIALRWLAAVSLYHPTILHPLHPGGSIQGTNGVNTAGVAVAVAVDAGTVVAALAVGRPLCCVGCPVWGWCKFFNTSYFYFYFRKRTPSSKGIEDADVMGTRLEVGRGVTGGGKRGVCRTGVAIFADDDHYWTMPQLG